MFPFFLKNPTFLVQFAYLHFLYHIFSGGRKHESLTRSSYESVNLYHCCLNSFFSDMFYILINFFLFFCFSVCVTSVLFQLSGIGNEEHFPSCVACLYSCLYGYHLFSRRNIVLECCKMILTLCFKLFLQCWSKK